MTGIVSNSFAFINTKFAIVLYFRSFALCIYEVKFKILVPHNKLLGSGSFGAVYTHVDKITQQVWAVKKVDLGMVASPSYQKVKLFI